MRVSPLLWTQVEYSFAWGSHCDQLEHDKTRDEILRRRTTGYLLKNMSWVSSGACPFLFNTLRGSMSPCLLDKNAACSYSTSYCRCSRKPKRKPPIWGSLFDRHPKAALAIWEASKRPELAFTSWQLLRPEHSDCPSKQTPKWYPTANTCLRHSAPCLSVSRVPPTKGKPKARTDRPACLLPLVTVWKGSLLFVQFPL